MYSALRPLLFKFDAELAHGLTLKALQAAHRLGACSLLAPKPASLPTTAFGIEFPNPVGLAAGLDKNGDYFEALSSLGFGFVEIGTITPKSQPGNPKPRIFRLPKAQAIINRLGFNNKGVEYLVDRVRRSSFKGILGVNIGKNKDTPNENAINDYLTCLARVYAQASYVTVNISSPNTQGLRDLQQENNLRELISTLREEQERLSTTHGSRKPMLIKIAPDLNPAELDSIATVLLSCQVDVVICTNTTIDRSTVTGQPYADETGGLSGYPMFNKATFVLREMAQRLDGKIPLIGTGGILAGINAAEKIRAGASLVQIYTGLIYRGPKLISESVNAIRQLRATRE